MKKSIVLVTLMLMVAGSAFGATIVDSKHDLSSSSAATNKSSTVDEICVFCHTPHGGGGSDFAPLWNRTTALKATIVSAYSSTTLNATDSNPANILKSDALLCMSCHDGATLTDNLTNPPNYPTAVNPSTGLSNTLGTWTNIGNLNGAAAAAGQAEMADDHPVGINYEAVDASVDDEIKDTISLSKVKLFKNKGATGANFVWCSSCHDVHNNTYNAFLVTSNAGSAICLACHDK